MSRPTVSRHRRARQRTRQTLAAVAETAPPPRHAPRPRAPRPTPRPRDRQAPGVAVVRDDGRVLFVGERRDAELFMGRQGHREHSDVELLDNRGYRVGDWL